MLTSTCIEYYSIDAFLYFMENGVNSLEEYRAALHFACLKGYLPIVQYLIQKGANIDSKDMYKETPLHHACWKGNLTVVQYLIEKGANIEAKDRNQYTPLHFASYHDKTEVIKYLISKGANKNAKTKDGETPHDLNEQIIEFIE